jgi:hypothetical protein
MMRNNLARAVAVKIGISVASFVVFAAFASAAVLAASSEGAREKVTKIVVQIQRADYEGDRTALKRLYDELAPFNEDKVLASRVRYWRGFALWRRVLNGFNETVDPKEQDRDLEQAVEEFNLSAAKDPGFADAKIGAESCLSFLVGLHRTEPARVQEIRAKAAPLRKEIEAEAPENPRTAFVMGSILWFTPAERGGGQDKSMEEYAKGLENARKLKGSVTDPLEPSWGEPELLMSLAGCDLYRTKPDLDEAEKYARAALEIVPYWHYVRDILMKQIQDAKAKRSGD